jgi:hypothetical protein
MVFLLTLLPFGILFFFYIYKRMLKKPGVKKRCNVLYHNLDYKRSSSLLYNSLFLFRRLIFTLMAVLL